MQKYHSVLHHNLINIYRFYNTSKDAQISKLKWPNTQNNPVHWKHTQ